MDSPESSRGFAKREIDSSDAKSERVVVDEEDWEISDKKKHRSSRSRKYGNGEEGEASDGSGRRRGYGDRNTETTRKRSSGSSRADSDENNDHDSRKELRSKQMKRRQEESTLEKLSSWYEDGELDNNKHDGGDKTGRKASSSKHLEHDGSQNRSRSKEDRSRDVEIEKMDRDYRYLEKSESGREKGHGSSEQVRSSRRKWDEVDAVRRSEDGFSEKGDLRSGKASDAKRESSRERSGSARNEHGESKSRGVDSSGEKVVKSSSREDRRADSERGKSKGKSEPLDVGREDNRLDRDRIEKPRRQRTPTGYDIAESWDRPSNADEDGNMRIRDKTIRETGNSNRSRTPERSGKRHQDSENSEMDYERSSSFKRKELENDVYKDDRSKGKDDTWNDRKKQFIRVQTSNK